MWASMLQRLSVHLNSAECAFSAFCVYSVGLMGTVYELIKVIQT